jgi:hypothetical protein
VLTHSPYSSIRPFDFITCPVCQGDEFTELGTGGGVWCDECNASFKVRGTSGDAGCVVDCHLDDLAGGFRLVLAKLGLTIKGNKYPWWEERPGVYFYKILKDPQPDGRSGDESSWIMASLDLAPEHLDEILYAKKEKHRPIWEHRTKPLIPKDDAVEAYRQRPRI